ncbi:DNA-directed RNA polymerase subunit alpha [Chitinispirillales bacterium ANBcel5]|uniref:DNA-directed RNA polymerase subunit alpha n=1 Tax=Cellulosispirillum alkaliphilum TaxID=3039283 RepID=UPI002A57CCAA|nr:DNA-directed RNA polymerase subunit alpha [Chitinispirillales bacterium ANBcel5]
MKWKSLLMPKGVQIENPENIPNFGKIIVEPLERGWGHTLGNALRRILLSSLQGAAVISVRVEGAAHEYSTLDGVVEDVSDIILNLKKLRLKLVADQDAVLKLEVSGEGEVKASDIEKNPDVEVLNPDLHIATINSDAKLMIEMRVSDGRGYVPAEMNKREDDPVGTIAIDSLFSPVTKVNYIVENTRVGQRTDLDKITFDVWTDGSLNVEDALGYASKLLYDHLELFINIEGEFEPVEETVRDEKTEKLRQLLKMRVDELELSVRSNNCLRAANIHTLADLVRNQESDMLKYKNFGRKSLIELNHVLGNLGLTFGMDVDKVMGQEQESA